MRAPKLIVPLILGSFYLGGCSTPVKSTVDGYGEAPLTRSDLLYFDRERAPLAEKPVVDSCKKAARDVGLKVSDASCTSCKRVEVAARLAGSSQAVRSSPGLGASVGVMGGGGSAFGLGFGGGNVDSVAQAERVIDIGVYEGASKNMLRSITVRSIGSDQSVTAVSYEMCVAAFKEYPANLKGRVYAIKPGEAE